MAPQDKKGNGPGRGGMGKGGGFPQMPKPKESLENQADLGVRTEAQKAQEDEIAALEAIYSGCFERKESKMSAWKQKESAFEVILTSTPLPENPPLSFDLRVNVEMPALYPKTAPRIHLSLDMGLHRVYEDSMRLAVDGLVARMLKNNQTLIVLDVLQELQQELDKATANKAEGAKLPSLEEQRALQVANQETQKAQDQAAREQEDKKKQQAEKEKSRTLAKTARFEASQSTPRPIKYQDKLSETIAPRDSLEQDFVYDFGKMLKVNDINGVEREVRKITGYQFHSRGLVSDCYKVVPDMPILPSQFLIVKRSRIKNPAKTGTGSDITVDVDTLQNSVRDAMTIGKGSDHIVQIHAFQITDIWEDNKTLSWILDILMEHGSMGSLSQFMSSAQVLTSNRACELGLEILEGLAYLHDNGIFHGDLHASNILLSRTTDGNVVAKIADIIFQDKVHRMTGVASRHQLLSKANSSWVPPELSDKGSGVYSDKTDVWFWGILLLQMLYGLNFMTLFSDVSYLLQQGATAESLQELISRVFQVKPKRRTRARDLKGYSYFTDNNSIADPPSRRNSFAATYTSMVLPPNRFAQEFEVMSELGEGGFGTVVKARRRLDGHEYAVKRIRESKGMPFDEMVREVQSLSSLHSVYIVRYYTAWVQDAPTGVRSVPNQFTNDGPDSDRPVSPLTLRGNALSSQYGSSARLNQSLDWVAKKSILSRHLSAEDTIDEETEDEMTSFDNFDEGSHHSDADESGSGDDESDEEGESHIQSGTATWKSEFEFDPYDSNPFGVDSRGPQDSHSVVDHNEQPTADSEEEEEEEDDTDYDISGAYVRELYIQMELCHGNLRNAIEKEELYNDPKEIARLLRQILEGLKYIHSQHQIHRDLKPENIFFNEKDSAKRAVRIGDFGLAAMGARRQFAKDRSSNAQPEDQLEDNKRTGGVGTAYYVAPEVKNGQHYGPKADMYSLGIILFELCYRPLKSGMERAQVLDKLRNAHPELPEDFNAAKFGGLDKIILKLVNHNQGQRPTADEVLASGELPDSIGVDVIRAAMSHLTDPKSVFHCEFVKAVLSRRQDEDEAQIKSLAWNLNNRVELLDPCHMVMRCTVKDELTRLFRQHGALDAVRPTIFPVAAENETFAVAKALGPDGTVLQLRYDLTAPLARSVATMAPDLEKLAAFGGTIKLYAIDDVYRESGANAISSHGEAAFDIISDGSDLSIKEAEVIKVLEEITATFPCLAREKICFNINHSDILTLVFDHCGVHREHRDVAIDSLGQLSVAQINWQDVERALAEAGLSKTSVVKLKEFIFREHPDAAFSKLTTLLEDSADLVGRLAQPISHIQEVVHYLGVLGVRSKILIAPLGCAKEKMCRGGLTFSCQIEDTRELLAAGGRYDSLLGKFAQQDKSEPKLSHAVGFGLGWDNLTAKMVSFYVEALHGKKAKRASGDEVTGIWRIKRCDVLVCSYDKNLLRNEALSLLNDLWASGISATLACDARQPEDIARAYKDDSQYWTVTVKQDRSVKIRTIGHDTAKNGDMKQKKNANAGDCTVQAIEVIPKLKALIRERESSGHGSSHATTTKRHEQVLTAGVEGHVTVLQSDNKNRKKNANDRVRSNVQTASMEMLQQMAKDVQTFAIDLPIDSELERIQDIPLTAENRWRDLAQKSYNGEIKARLVSLYEELVEYKNSLKVQKRPRHVILCNLRTGHTVLYDVARDA